MIKSFLGLSHTVAGSMVGLPYFIEAIIALVKKGWSVIPKSFFNYAIPIFFVVLIAFLGIRWVTTLPDCATVPENTSCVSN